MSALKEEVAVSEPHTVMSSGSFENENEMMTEYAMASSVEDGKFAFPFNLPKGLGVRGAGIVDGIPELRFGASPNTPRILKQDFAAAMRLANEGKRPEFFYIGIWQGHPYRGRQYKQYKPQWMRGTSFGETFSEADWKMKCLQIGAKSDESKSQFWAWEKTSKLEGLATRFDFRNDKSHGSVIMSCNSVKVQKSDDELMFEGEPRMRINAESNMRYSKYISKNFRAVAYHDEPLFLKLQELIKLVLIAEWFVEKGVKIDEEWMMNNTQPTRTSSHQQVAVKAIEDCGLTHDSVAEPPSELIPQPIDFQPPNCNVTVNTKEAKLNKSVAKQGVRRRYGWYDSGNNEGVMFDQDGTLYKQQRSLKMVVEQSESVNGKSAPTDSVRLCLPLPPDIPLPTMSEFGDFVTKGLPAGKIHHNFTNALGQMSSLVKTENSVSERGVQLKTTRITRPSPPLNSPHIKETHTIKISVDDFDTLYDNMDPNQPIWPEIPGKQEAIIPNVSSWCELYKETVPWPHTWQTPHIGVGKGEPVATGGVSARHIQVRKEAVKPREVVSETTWKDQYKQRNGELIVRGVSVTARAVFVRLTGEEFDRAAAKFISAWHAQKGAPPSIHHIFSVKNRSLEIKWSTYRQGLSYQNVEKHFHGTSLLCNILGSRSPAPCTDGNCGICGISCSGLDRKCIRKNIKFQRFGHGFYLAPNSSKCHDYTRGANGYRAMLLCDVCPGRKHDLETKSQDCDGPPPGYDSICGKVGSELNYPELVVYEPEAVLPRLIFVYKKDGTAHPLSG